MKEEIIEVISEEPKKEEPIEEKEEIIEVISEEPKEKEQIEKKEEITEVISEEPKGKEVKDNVTKENLEAKNIPRKIKKK